MADRIALGQLDLWVDVRAPVHGDDAVAMHELPQHDDVAAGCII